MVVNGELILKLRRKVSTQLVNLLFHTAHTADRWVVEKSSGSHRT